MEEIDVEAGNRVQIITKSEELEGILLESMNSEIVLLKLKSGYNIGINLNNIKLIKKIKFF